VGSKIGKVARIFEKLEDSGNRGSFKELKKLVFWFLTPELLMIS